MKTAKTITDHIVESAETRRTLFRVMSTSLFVLSVMYGYMIGSITFNVLARKSLESNIRELGSQVSTLELAYLNNANQIDKTFALSRGFVDVKSNIFATRDSSRVAVR